MNFFRSELRSPQMVVERALADTIRFLESKPYVDDVLGGNAGVYADTLKTSFVPTISSSNVISIPPEYANSDQLPVLAVTAGKKYVFDNSFYRQTELQRTRTVEAIGTLSCGLVSAADAEELIVPENVEDETLYDVEKSVYGAMWNAVMAIVPTNIIENIFLDGTTVRCRPVMMLVTKSIPTTTMMEVVLHETVHVLQAEETPVVLKKDLAAISSAEEFQAYNTVHELGKAQLEAGDEPTLLCHSGTMVEKFRQNHHVPGKPFELTTGGKISAFYNGLDKAIGSEIAEDSKLAHGIIRHYLYGGTHRGLVTRLIRNQIM